jgi:hypothetical protein
LDFQLSSTTRQVTKLPRFLSASEIARDRRGIRFQAFTSLAHVWPSTTPDHWWVDVNQKPIGGLIPSAEVPAVLALVDFHAEAWTVSPVDPKAVHPRRPIDRAARP